MLHIHTYIHIYIHTGEVNVELDPDHISLLYVILAHEHPAFVERLIQALDEPMHSFVIHVDGKAEETYRHLQVSERVQDMSDLKEALKMP